MSGNFEDKNMFSRFPLLFWLGGIFCFLLLPAILVNIGLERFLLLRHDREVEEVLQRMDNRLNYLKNQVDDAVFYQKILAWHFNRASASEDPFLFFQRSRDTLKKALPARFKFIVWDSAGKPVDYLTDEKSYRYIVRNLYDFFRVIAEHCKGNPPGNPENLAIVEKRLSLFRSYLGRFLVPSHLRMPFLAGDLARCILANHHARLPFFWFDVNEKLAVFCAIQPLQKYSGVNYTVNRLNKAGEIFKTGVIDMNNIDKHQHGLSEDEFRQLQIELGMFENASLPHRKTRDAVFAFKLLSPDMRGFCFMRREDLPTGYPDILRWQFLSKFAGIFLVFIFCLYVYHLCNPNKLFSIAWRTAFLFLYANGLPLLILATIGAEYLQQKETALIQQIHNDQEKILLEIDSGYRRHRQGMQNAVKELLRDFSEEMNYRKPSADDQNLLGKLADRLVADEIAILGVNGEAIVSFTRGRRIVSQTFLRMFASSAIAYANQKESDFFLRDETVDTGGADSLGRSLLRDNEAMLKDLQGTFERVVNYTFGLDEKLCFARLLGRKSQKDFHSAIIIFWQQEEVQNAFSLKKVNQLSKASDGMSYAAFARHSAEVSSPAGFDHDILRIYLQKAFNMQSCRENNLKLSGKRHIFTAIAGRQLGNMALASILCAEPVEAQVHQTRIRMILFALASLLIVSGVIITLSRQFLFPVKQLQEAVRQIARRDFSFQTQISSNDEFGDLGKVFNRTIREMEDLAIGKVIQETLLPGNTYEQNGISIFARTVSMTKLGGDYYDFFSLSGNRTGIFMGDVAGHGIPAALVMAMAKSTVLTCPELLSDPSSLLTGIHQMLYRLKSSGFKRMMTCQYLMIDDVSGSCIFANAGHCYPVIVSPGGKSARFYEVIGSPVGIGKRARYANHDINLEPGETVILYSDCMIEATNAHKQMFGADRLLEIAESCWSENLQLYYNRLFETNRLWSAEIEDDNTIVLARFNPGDKDV